MKKNLIYNQSCTDMSDLDNGSIGLVVTSPPYFSAKNYGYDLEYGFDLESYDAYLNFLKDVFKECYRVLEDGRYIIVNTSNIIVMTSKYRIDNVRLPIVTDPQRVLQEIGYEFVDDIIWEKPESACINRQANFFQTRKPLSYRPNQVIEYLLVYRKKGDGKDYFKGIDEKIMVLSDVDDNYETSNVWKIRPETNSKHPAPYPIELPQKCIQYYSFVDDVILDPFMGSGTTAIASLMENRHYVGYELNNDFIQMAKRRISEEESKLFKPSLDSVFSRNKDRIEKRKSVAFTKTKKKKSNSPEYVDINGKEQPSIFDGDL